MIDAREAILLDAIETIAEAMDGLKGRGRKEGAEVLARTIYSAREFARQVREQEGIPDTMPAGWNRPAPASLRELCDVLEDASERVGIGDSFEGTITWVMPTDEVELAGAEFGLVARYRVGNLDGQGGVRVFTAGDHDPSA